MLRVSMLNVRRLKVVFLLFLLSVVILNIVILCVMATVMELPKEPIKVQPLSRCWYFSVQSIADVNVS